MKLLVELEPRRHAFWSTVAAAFHPVKLSQQTELGLWRDVFVRQELPWRRFLQSIVLHSGALALIWMVSLTWLRQQSIVATPDFDRSSLITYTPEEYLPPLDTGVTDPAPPAKGDPEFAKQPILSVPPEADNRRQTIVAPPDVRLNHDVPLPNMIAMSTPAPVVPIEATRAPLHRMAALDSQVVAPAPQVDTAQSRVVRSALTSPIIAPPPEVTSTRTRGMSGPDTAVVEPPPADVSRSTVGRAGAFNLGPSQVVAPAPQLTVAEQHTLSGRGTGGIPSGSLQPVAPPPSVGSIGGSGASGRLVALGIHPVAPSGPVATPGGNRRGTFAANPSGRVGAAGTPGSTQASGTKATGNGVNGSVNGTRGRDNSLPSGLHVGAADSASGVSSNGNGDPREMASAAPPRVGGGAKTAAPVTEDRVTDVDRQVFGGKRIYSMTSNTPNLNSSTGSWVIRFAELKSGKQSGELSAPDAIQKSDPGYPMELMKANVQGTVTLYAVIHSDGTVGDIRVLTSPDDRLDALAKSALARWKFRPATKDGQPVALEAVVIIPFRAKRTSY